MLAVVSFCWTGKFVGCWVCWFVGLWVEIQEGSWEVWPQGMEKEEERKRRQLRIPFRGVYVI
jgi:hypothetical protein